MNKSDQAPSAFGDAARQIVVFASGAAAGVCFLFISAILSLSVHPLSGDLHFALVSFAIALPLLIASAVMSFVRILALVSYCVFVSGALILELGVFWVLHHLDPIASSAFVITSIGCNFLFLVGASVTMARWRRK